MHSRRHYGNGRDWFHLRGRVGYGTAISREPRVRASLHLLLNRREQAHEWFHFHRSLLRRGLGSLVLLNWGLGLWTLLVRSGLAHCWRTFGRTLSHLWLGRGSDWLRRSLRLATYGRGLVDRCLGRRRAGNLRLIADGRHGTAVRTLALNWRGGRDRWCLGSSRRL